MSFILYDEVKSRTGYSRVQLWRKARNPTDPFPAPYQLGANRVGFDEAEIAEWERSRPRVNYASHPAEVTNRVATTPLPNEGNR
jgi:predicted DNA-binding transcriptional regulator AlpA